MNNRIKTALLNGRLVLLLGAGASYGSKNSQNKNVPLGGELADILAQELGEELDGEELSEVYAAARSELGAHVDKILERNFKHCKPSNEYLELVKYPLFRIYTLNIDDAIEAAFHQVNSGRKLNVWRRNDRVVESDQFYQTLDYVKLNGDINSLSDGFIFSPQEYGEGSANSPVWYQELARDFHKYTFLFVGTKLKEPLFSHQVASYKAKTSSSSLKSFILIPSLSKIQQASLESSNIEYIPGTLKEFTDWLKKEFDKPPTGFEVLSNVRPELRGELNKDSKHIELFKAVTPVNRANLALLENNVRSKIRDFYKGFKPTWFDIMDGVPAWLEKVDCFYNDSLSGNQPTPLDLYVVFGAAGAGKSTCLRQLALKLSDEGDRPVYFIDEFKQNLVELIAELDHRHETPYYLFIERVNYCTQDLAGIIKSSKSNKVIFITSENPKIWSTRVKEHLSGFVSSQVDISQITPKDADTILNKLKEHGNWTRLQKMPPKKRRLELLKKSKGQLLIGLLETTSGEGYKKIIQKDYTSIECESEKALLILAGLATTQGVTANEVTLTRAMSYLGLNQNIFLVASNMDGVVKYYRGSVTTRHRVYMDNLYKFYVSKSDLLNAICAYITAFSVYNFPIVKNISSTEFSIYKYLVNYKALKKLFKGDESKILSIYERFEKEYENEGLFLMQYGLALRGFDRNEEAYEKLKIAQQAFPESPHIEHALALQRIILACKETSENVAMALFGEAKEVLLRLSSSNISPETGGTDRYPIITLAEGHVIVLDNLGKQGEAKVTARQYHDDISRNKALRDNHRIKKTLTKLMKYTISGRWVRSENDEF